MVIRDKQSQGSKSQLYFIDTLTGHNLLLNIYHVTLILVVYEVSSNVSGQEVTQDLFVIGL